MNNLNRVNKLGKIQRLKYFKNYIILRVILKIIKMDFTLEKYSNVPRFQFKNKKTLF